MNLPASELLERIVAIGAERHFNADQSSLLHAYIACLSFTELCAIVANLLGGPTKVRLALRSRLLRLLRQNNPEQDAVLLLLIHDTVNASEMKKTLRRPADALHAALFSYLSLSTQQMLLGRWVRRGTIDAMARWLKATGEDPALFDESVAIRYWRMSHDWRAARSLAYQASPERLTQIVPELIEHCDEGWIISKAIIRSDRFDDSLWERVRARHPATYLYLAAQMHRPIAENEAFELVLGCSGSAVGGNRGLAIWSVGQMGMANVLDRIRTITGELQKRDMTEFLGTQGDTDH